MRAAWRAVSGQWSYSAMPGHSSVSSWTTAGSAGEGDSVNHSQPCRVSGNIKRLYTPGRNVFILSNQFDTISLKDLLFLLMSLVALLMNMASSLLVRSDVSSSRAELLDSSWKVHCR